MPTVSRESSSAQMSSGSVAGLPASGDQPLRDVEFALAQPVAFEDVAPATRADGEIHC